MCIRDSTHTRNMHPWTCGFSVFKKINQVKFTDTLIGPLQSTNDIIITDLTEVQITKLRLKKPAAQMMGSNYLRM